MRRIETIRSAPRRCDPCACACGHMPQRGGRIAADRKQRPARNPTTVAREEIRTGACYSAHRRHNEHRLQAELQWRIDSRRSPAAAREFPLIDQFSCERGARLVGPNARRNGRSERQCSAQPRQGVAENSRINAIFLKQIAQKVRLDRVGGSVNLHELGQPCPGHRFRANYVVCASAHGQRPLSDRCASQRRIGAA